MSILLTGGTGFIGSHTAVEMINKGYDVVIVDNLYNSEASVVDRIESITGVRPNFYEADVADKAELSKVFEENSIDAVIHFAGYKAVGESVQIPVAYYRNNLDTTLSLLEVMKEYGYTGGLKVTISMPAGVEIAKKTFNPRLGIVGGLSVLGTSGIVEPMSERALIETMYVEINAQKAKGNKNLLVFFGNYGEDFTRDVMKLNLADSVTCSNFVGELLDYAVYCGFETLLMIGHSGKLVKLAQGVMNTHSKYADCRTEFMAMQAMFHGASTEVGKEIFKCLTTDEVTKVLQREGLFDEVMKEVTDRIDFYMQHRVHGKIKTGALMFSNVYGILGRTEHADELIALHTLD